MRHIQAEEIIKAVSNELIKINTLVPDELRACFERAQEGSSGAGKLVMEDILANALLAEQRSAPLCQDTGMVVFFVQQGIEAILEEPLQATLDRAVAETYSSQGYRPSVVSDPLERQNTGNNTPAVVYIEQQKGHKLVIEMMVKGFGSENMSMQGMLKPAEGFEGIKQFVVEAVRRAGGNPCPPVIVGVGVGGTFEQSALMAKKSLLRSINQGHGDANWSQRERAILKAVNELGIGPGGLGGGPTALAVHIEVGPTHIAALPVAVNIVCHSSRHGRVEI